MPVSNARASAACSSETSVGGDLRQTGNICLSNFRIDCASRPATTQGGRPLSRTEAASSKAALRWRTLLARSRPSACSSVAALPASLVMVNAVHCHSRPASFPSQAAKPPHNQAASWLPMLPAAMFLANTCESLEIAISRPRARCRRMHGRRRYCAARLLQHSHPATAHQRE